MLAVGWGLFASFNTLYLFTFVFSILFSIQIVHSMFTKMFNNITVYKAPEYFNVCYSLMMV
jgi:hypothetical protein